MSRFINDDVKLRKGGRKATKITIDELKEQIVKFHTKHCLEEGDEAYTIETLSLYDIFENDNINKDMKFALYWEDYYDSVKEIEDFGADNDVGESLIGFHTLDNGFTFLGVGGHADWGLRSFTILYYDGKTIRCYTPSYGNLINLDCKCAFGQEGEFFDIDEDKLTKKYKKLGVYEEADTSGVNSVAKVLFADTLAGWDEMYLSIYGLDYDTAFFNWDAIKEDILSRIEII